MSTLETVGRETGTYFTADELMATPDELLADEPMSDDEIQAFDEAARNE